MLTADEARDELKLMVAWQTEPKLSEDDLTVLLRLAAMVDENGLGPKDPDWTPTYSPVYLNRAAARGWRVKAGKLTADKTMSDERGNSHSPETRRQDMMDLADDYDRKVVGTIRVQPFADLTPVDRLGNVVLN